MQLPENPTFRALLLGYPKAGKTGSLVALLKAGFRVIYNDLDGNPEVLKLAGEHTKNLIYLPYEDKVRLKGTASDARLAGISSDPKAYFRYMEFLEKGVYVSPDGAVKETYGPMASWGPDTVNVTDSFTRLIDAIWAHYMFKIGRNGRRKNDWGAIVDEASYVCSILMSRRLNCHNIMIAHLQLTGADPLEEADNSGKRSDIIDYNNLLKQQKAELIGPRLFPRAVTKAHSEVIAAKFPVVLPVEVNGDGKRVFDLTPRKELAVSLPADAGKLKKTYPAETGLLDIFEAVTGYRTPETVQE